jgi:hypothetical protein
MEREGKRIAHASQNLDTATHMTMLSRCCGRGCRQGWPCAAMAGAHLRCVMTSCRRRGSQLALKRRPSLWMASTMGLQHISTGSREDVTAVHNKQGEAMDRGASPAYTCVFFSCTMQVIWALLCYGVDLQRTCSWTSQRLRPAQPCMPMHNSISVTDTATQ